MSPTAYLQFNTFKELCRFNEETKEFLSVQNISEQMQFIFQLGQSRGNLDVSESIKEIGKHEFEMFHTIFWEGYPTLNDLLLLAVKADCVAMIYLILESEEPPPKTHPEIRSFLGGMPLNMAIEIGAEKTIGVLLQYSADPNIWYCGTAPIHRAVMKGNHKVVESLLLSGADRNLQDYHGWTPVHMTLVKEDKKMLSLLASHCADFNIRDTEGWTPLYMAIQTNHPNMIPCLARYGADFYSQDDDGVTPLQAAQQKNCICAVHLLIALGAY